MRNIDALLLAQFQAEKLSPITFCKFLFDSGTLFLWSGLGTFTWAGDVYQGAGELLSAQEIQETNQIKAAGVEMTLSSLPSGILSYALTENYQGRTAEIYFGAINLETGALIGNPNKVFSGKMDIMELLEDGETCTVKFSIENDLISLTRPNKRYYTPADQAREFPNDRGLDFVVSIQDIGIKWGG